MDEFKRLIKRIGEVQSALNKYHAHEVLYHYTYVVMMQNELQFLLLKLGYETMLHAEQIEQWARSDAAARWHGLGDYNHPG